MFRLSKPTITLIQAITFLSFMYSCSPKITDYEVAIYQTSQSGDNLKLITKNQPTQSVGEIKKVSLQINPEQKFQKYVGFGASFTESSAWNLATIPVESRKEVLTKLFSPTEGAGFTLTRTHINSSDYSNNHYTYIE